MSEEKFIKGPWEAIPQGHGFGHALDVFACDGINRYICTTSGNAKHNAHLIAQAPAMYELLKQAEVLIRYWGRDDGALYQNIQEVLKKARGEQ